MPTREGFQDSDRRHTCRRRCACSTYVRAWPTIATVSASPAPCTSCQSLLFLISRSSTSNAIREYHGTTHLYVHLTLPRRPAGFQDFPSQTNWLHLLASDMAGHAEPSPLGLRHSHWHTSRANPPQTKSAVHIDVLEHRRAHSDPAAHFRPQQQSALRHSSSSSSSMPVGAAASSANDSGSCPTVPAGGSETCESLSKSSTGNTRGDSDGSRAAIGKPSLVRVVSTAPRTTCESSEDPGSPGLAQTLPLSPSAGSMQIALKPRLSHQHTPIPTHHATTNIPLKPAVRHTKTPSLPRLSINIPQKHCELAHKVIDMATSLASPPPATPRTSLPGEKRVTFSNQQPEIIPQPSKRRQSSVNQRPSWSSVFLLRDSKVRDDVAARSRSLSPGPSILKEISAFKSDASDAELKKDEHGNEPKVHISPLWEKNLKRLPRGRQAKKNALPIPQAKVSRNASPRALSPEEASPRDVSPTSLSTRHASPREDTFPKSMNVVLHPPSPPESEAEEDDEDEEAIDDSDESPRHSRNSSIEEVEDVEAIDNRFGKIDIDGSSHAHRHEPRKDSQDSRKDSASSRKDSQDSRKDSQDWRESRKSSYGHRRSSNASRKDSKGSNEDSDRPAPPRRRSSSADQAEMWLRRSSIYGVRSKAPRLPTRLGTMRV